MGHSKGTPLDIYFRWKLHQFLQPEISTSRELSLNSAPKFGPGPNRYLHVCVQLEVCSLIAQSKIILRQFRLGCVKSHLIAGKPSSIAYHGPAMDGRSREVNVSSTTQVQVLPLVSCLQLPTLLPGKEQKFNPLGKLEPDRRTSNLNRNI